MQYVQSNAGLVVSARPSTGPGKASCSNFRAFINRQIALARSHLSCLALTTKPGLECNSWLGVLPCDAWTAKSVAHLPTVWLPESGGARHCLPPFLGRSFGQFSWPFLKFFKSFWTPPAHPASCQPQFFNQVWLPAWRRRYRPAQLGVPEPRGRPKSFSTRLRVGSVRVRPLRESAKVPPIPLGIPSVCLRAFTTCCKANCKLFKLLGRDAISRARDALFRLNFVSTYCNAEDGTQMDGAGMSLSSRKAFLVFRRRFMYIYINGFLSRSSVSSCRLALMVSYPHSNT